MAAAAVVARRKSQRHSRHSQYNARLSDKIDRNSPRHSQYSARLSDKSDSGAPPKKLSIRSSSRESVKELVLNDPDLEKYDPVAEKPAGWRRYQPLVRYYYDEPKSQIGVAILIALNFLISIVQAQIDPTETLYVGVFNGLDYFFTIAFTIELFINMYGHWLCDFWRNGWNVFDFIVVFVSLLFTFSNLEGPLENLRMLRAFRVFRLFKRVKSLRKVLNSIVGAVPGVANVFLIQLIFMSIYAIICVDQFQGYAADKTFVNQINITVTDYQTGRSQPYGFEYFGNFGKSLYTQFQALTGDSWSEAIARPLVLSNDGQTSVVSSMAFVSFQLLCAFVLVNVVIAVLLERMVGVGDPDDSDEEEEATCQVSTCHDTLIEGGETVLPEKVTKPHPEVEKLQAEITSLKAQMSEMHTLIMSNAALFRK